MNKIKKILVPTDFSKPAANAFAYALQLADKLDAEVQLLHVVFPQGGSLDMPVMVAQVTQTQVERARKQMEHFIKNVEAKVKSNLVDKPLMVSNIEVGTPIQTISDIAKRDNVDLIVMGSRGDKRSMVEKWIGSIAVEIVRRPPCPVMVIPEEFQFQNLSAIAYATDANNADPYAIWKTTKLLAPITPVIHCVHVNMKKEGNINAWEKMEEIKSFFEEQSPGMAFYLHHFPGKRIENDLNDFVEVQKINLLVMYQPNHSFWDRLFHRSITKRLAKYTTVPLLVMPEDAK